MASAGAGTDGTTALLDARQRFMQRTASALLLFAAVLALAMTALHRWQQAPWPSQFVPPLLAVVFCLLLLWHRRHPERVQSTMWSGWLVVVFALALPVWRFIADALDGGTPLVQSLPPIGAMFLPALLVMVVFARPRQAMLAACAAWLLVAAPVLVYLAGHDSELRTPRGLDLAIELGPFGLFAALLVPFVRGVERHYRLLADERERLQQLAERDVLIGLYNRRAGERFLATVLAHGEAEAAVMLFDIDHFKRINDGFGHPAGDAVLKEVGRRCAAQLSGEDVFARWGGEEFLVLLPSATPAAAAALAERLRSVIAATPIAPVGAVSASFGVTAVHRDDTLHEVLQRADEALYAAKAAGRNRVVLRDMAPA